MQRFDVSNNQFSGNAQPSASILEYYGLFDHSEDVMILQSPYGTHALAWRANFASIKVITYSIGF